MMYVHIVRAYTARRKGHFGHVALLLTLSPFIARRPEQAEGFYGDGERERCRLLFACAVEVARQFGVARVFGGVLRDGDEQVPPGHRATAGVGDLALHRLRWQ